jgi:hypothetical protein
MYWSPNDTTDVNARDPQMRQVLRVTRMGEKDRFAIRPAG